VDRAGPADGAYWKQAAEGAVFYTEAADHYNCPVGSFTHGITLPPERAKELEHVVGTMVGLQYIRMEEVGALPRRTAPFQVAVYAPLAETPAPPDVVLVRGRARQIMLVAEAARAAGIAGDGASMGRPACAVIPAVLGGPTGYSEQFGGHPRMIQRHLNRHLTQAQRRQWVSLLLDTADQIGMPDDPECSST